MGSERRLDLHIANENHYSSQDPFPFPKLFVYSNEQLAFGFYIEAPLDPDHSDAPKYGYWRALKKKLQNDRSTLDQLLTSMEKHDLTLGDYYRGDGGVFGGCFKVKDGSINFDSLTSTKATDISRDEFIHRVTRPDSTSWMDLHVFAKLDKRTAIDLKGEVARPVLSVLGDLATIYETSITLRDD